MRIVLVLEAILREQLKPHKINLASLGNMTPHLHWHVIPRFEADPHFPLPVWGQRQRDIRLEVPQDLGMRLAATLAARLAK